MAFRVDRHYFVYALSGSMRLEADGSRWTLPPARGALVAANHPVEITVLSPLNTASVLFQEKSISPTKSLVVFEISLLCQELVRACRLWGKDDPQDEYARRMFRALGAEVVRLAASPSPWALKTPKDKMLAKAVSLTEDRLADALNFEDIASSVGCTPRTLARRFSDEMGMTWRETLRRLRIMRSAELLATSRMPITEIALIVGYNSLSAFNAAFRDILQITPSEYRRSVSPAS